MRFETTRKRLTTFTAISLTDIVFLLLIFFLLSSSFIIQPGIKVTLPEATKAAVEAGQKVYLTLTRDGKIYVDGQIVTKGRLGREVRRLLAKAPDKLVVIKADKNLTLEKIIEVLDIVRMAGAERFLIATRPVL